MTNSLCRRKFLAISAATAVLGVTRRSWAQEKTAAPEPADIRRLNDYCVAEISTSAIKHNLGLIRRELKPSTKLCAVIKANCYGHGWPECMEAIASEADWLAVAAPEEAIAVRQSGWQKPILLLMASGFPGEVARGRLRQLISQHVTLTVAASGDLAAISSVATEIGQTANVHIKIDSGMTRSGVRTDKAPALIHQARGQSGIALTGLYTHFCMSDAPDKSVTWEQLAKFLATVKACGDDATGLMLHAASSAATLEFPESHLDMVRVGTAMYGHQPCDEPTRRLPLRAAMRVIARLSQVKEVSAGARVGYSQTYRFEQPGRIGLVPIGYADGYRRAFSNRAVMRIGDHLVPVRGRVSMDQTIVDLTELPDARVGDEVEVISPDAEAPNSVENLARLADTILHEILCGLGPRVRRIRVA